MRISGLFVGVSKLSDPGITELRFAHRDAMALHSVFADMNLEGGGYEGSIRLLTDQNATRQAVLQAVTDIQAEAATDTDMIVVHLSCHGSPSGALVMHDTVRTNVDSTGIPVAELVGALGTIVNKPVVLTLDCCFAGVALGMNESPNRDAFNQLMHDFGNQSRLVGCAAEFGQSAFEDRELGRGFFSHALWSRIQEAYEAGENRISAFDWIADAVQRTTELARTRGRAQTAAAFATVRNAGMTLVVPRDRPNQLRLIVPENLPPVSENIDSLIAHGLDLVTAEALRRRLRPTVGSPGTELEFAL